MRRKLVKQGENALTVTLPAQWLREHELGAGDEVEIAPTEHGLLIASAGLKHAPKTISFTLPKSRESAMRTLIVNAYRAGADKILVTYDGDEKQLSAIVDTFLVGFEVFSAKNPVGSLYSIESVSEPSLDNFETIIRRQLYLIQLILGMLPDSSIKEYVYKVQKYDNFLKRCLSKGLYSNAERPFLWQFLSNLTQVARLCYHFTADLCSQKFSKESASFLKDVRDIFDIIQKAYLKQDYSILPTVHEKEQQVLFEKGRTMLTRKDGITMHYLMLIGRIVYLANSPLTGLLQVRSFQSERKP